MDKKQQENRRQATQRFMHSLHELEAVLQSDTTGNDAPPKKPELVRPLPPTDDLDDDSLDALLGDAVQDIGQFMAEHPDDAHL